MNRTAAALARLALAPLLLALAAVPAFAQPAAAEDAGAEVRAVLERQVEAWNRGDVETFTSFYAENAVFVSPSGVHRGRDEVLARYRRRYPDRAAMGQLGFEVLDLRVTARAVSLAASWHLAYPEGGREDASGHTLLVLLPREGGGWEIAQDASM